MDSSTAVEPLYTAEQIRIPPELPDILKNYTKHIIRTQPGNILEESAEYFGRLAKQKTDNGNIKRLNNMQLEGFYHKFDQAGQSMVARKDIDDACNSVNIPAGQVADVLRLGGWSGDRIPWLKCWALFCSAAAGTLPATIETVTSILGDNGRVRTAPVVEVLQYLGEQDPTIDKSTLDGVIRTIMGDQSPDYDIDALVDLARRELRPRSGNNLPKPTADTTETATSANVDEPEQSPERPPEAEAPAENEPANNVPVTE